MWQAVGEYLKDLSGYEVYVLAVCLISFLATFFVLFTMLMMIVGHEMRSIKHGLSDDKIIHEYMINQDKKFTFSAILYFILTLIVTAIIVFFAWSVAVRFSTDKVEGPGAVPRVVLSDSMSYKRSTNTYLEENNLNDQFDTFDLILTYELPGEFDIQLYDVVVYETEKGDLLVHRIVGIEEPNEKHPEHRLFQLRGDAVRWSDEPPAEYSQFRAIYRGEKIRYVGSFIHFMQSPPGYLCILLALFGCVISPIVDLVVKGAKNRRLRALGYR